METSWSAFQAREVRLVLPLDVLEACEELFRGVRRLSMGAQLRQELGLPRHAGGTLADMAADHLQLGFPVCPVLRHSRNHSIRLVPAGDRGRPSRPSPLSHEPVSPIIAKQCGAPECTLCQRSRAARQHHPAGHDSVWGSFGLLPVQPGRWCTDAFTITHTLRAMLPDWFCCKPQDRVRTSEASFERT